MINETRCRDSTSPIHQLTQSNFKVRVNPYYDPTSNSRLHNILNDCLQNRGGGWYRDYSTRAFTCRKFRIWPCQFRRLYCTIEVVWDWLSSWSTSWNLLSGYGPSLGLPMQKCWTVRILQLLNRSSQLWPHSTFTASQPILSDNLNTPYYYCMSNHQISSIYSDKLLYSSTTSTFNLLNQPKTNRYFLKESIHNAAFNHSCCYWFSSCWLIRSKAGGWNRDLQLFSFSRGVLQPVSSPI